MSSLITFNTYKLGKGGLLTNMSDVFNARVGDQNTPLVIQWRQGTTDTEIDLIKNKLHFFATGQVGNYLEQTDTGYTMSDDASFIEYEDTAGEFSLPHGITSVKLPAQFFPQEGIFYGYFGLKDDQGTQYTAVNVWFRVLGGIPLMGAAIPYFSTQFDALVEKFKGDTSDALQELRKKYQAEVQANEDMSDETRTALSKLADAVGAIQAQIDAGNVVTLIQHNADIKRTSEMIENKLAQMSLIPETFANSDAIKEAYPNGKTGIMVAVDTGHKWIWFNGQWNDCGAYQSAGYPEVTEARVGADQLGAKKYESLSEALHRQIDALSNLGNQSFSYPVTGTVGQQVSLQSEWEAGIKAGATLRVKFDLKGDSDLSVIQVYANGAFFNSIERQNFGTWQDFKLDKDIGTLGLVIPDDKFSKNFNAEISFEVITVPVADVRSELNPLKSYAFSVSPSTSKDELKPNAITHIDLEKGSKIYIRLKADADDNAITGYQLTANGQFFQSFNDLNVWHEVTLTDETTSLGFQTFTKAVNQDFDGIFQVVGETLGAIYYGKADTSELNPLMFHEFSVSPSTSKDELKPNAITHIDLEKGSKIYIRLKADADDNAITGYQLTANGQFFQSFNDLNVWHEVTLTDETTSLGFQSFKGYVNQDFDGVFQVVGETLGTIYGDQADTSKRNLSKLLTLSLPISATAGVDTVNQTAVNGLYIPKGSKIRVRFATDCDPDLLEAYQIWANNQYLTGWPDTNWHEITLPADTTSLGYAFFGSRVHGDITGSLEILGENLNELYSMIDDDIEERSKNGLNSSMLEKLTQKENQINTITNGITHGVNFVFMTDPHFPTNDLLSKPMMQHVLEHTSAPFVLCGGDFPGAYGTKDDVLESVKTVIDYQNSIGKDRFFSVQANHDFTIKKSPDENTGWTASNALVYDTLIRPNEAYLPSIQAGKEYYYIDIFAQKTRIFMLNSMDGNPTAENTDAWGTQFVISQDQADWLVEKTKEKDGWKFIFICHVPCDSNLDSYLPNEEFFHKVATAINGKQKLSYHDTGINEDADFTDTTNQVVTILAGHNHIDQSSFKDGVLSITTTSDARYIDGGWARQPQSYTSPAFDVVSIDYDKGTINTTRIGGGQDRVFSYVAPNQGEEISYLHLKPVADLAVNGTAKCVVDMATPVVAEVTEWSNNCFTWSSSDSTIAEVDASGVITAHASGTVTITVATRDGQHSDRCNVTVK